MTVLLVAHWARDIVFHPRLVAAVQELLGTENVICWESDIVSKPAGSQHFFSWHQVVLPEGKVVWSVTRLSQDSTYSGHSPADSILTAWVALTPATEEMGCLHYRPRSHATQLHHYETRDPANLLVVGQTIPDTIVE